MPIATARAATDRPERYLKQLVSHLGHKVTAELAGDGRATLTFDDGTCVLTPAGDEIELIATAAAPDTLTRVQDVVTRHLERFGAQEELRVQWTAPVDGGDLSIIDPAVSAYVLTHCTPPGEILHELTVRTREATGRAAAMQISHDEGAFLSMLVKLTGARHAIEVGVFTGYSALCIARALPSDGRLLACDTSEEWTSIARPFWERAGVADRIDLKIGPATETLRALPAEPAFDIAFIDADKASYPTYYEEILQRLRPGGLIVLDNVFLAGRSLDPAYQEERHLAMRRLNDFIAADDRVDAVMLTVRDGVTLARKR
ncbi:hypothetical protein GCM10009665_69900 [Kitasatospora nipponensis]|uniref:O-methyltransferase YrrM n=1 Tax=Kitasatospora nipponensis TaxID=258049 RepID=A0ABN1X127_9ACTN